MNDDPKRIDAPPAIRRGFEPSAGRHRAGSDRQVDRTPDRTVDRTADLTGDDIAMIEAAEMTPGLEPATARLAEG